MSSIDPEVLYLILTKVAAKEPFYSFDGKKGTITRRQLGEVYERITGSRVGSRMNWDAPLTQLNTLLQKCGLPAIGLVLSESGSITPELIAVHAKTWPPFSALKGLYSKKN
jgi:hypothetical protein